MKIQGKICVASPCLAGVWITVTVLVATSGLAQTGDYGDAPDMPGINQFGQGAGHYPTLNPTGNTVFPGRTGPYHLDLSQEFLGTRVDDESAARVINRDPFDDGFRNFFFLLVQIPVPTYVTVEVTIPSGAAGGTRYVNLAADFNQDGKWQRYTDIIGQQVPEWVVRNHPIQVPGDILPGETKAFVLPAFGWGNGLLFAYQTWFRITVAETPLSLSDFGLDGWDGSGPAPGFPTGETEDYFWRGYGKGVAPGGGNGPNEGEGESEGEEEGEGEGEGGTEGETTEGEEPCDDVEIVWFPRVVPLGQEGARFCMRVCNRCPNDVEVTIEFEKVQGNNVNNTQAPDPATIPAGECVWICFTASWQDQEPVGGRLGRYRPKVKIVSDKMDEKVWVLDEMDFEETIDPASYPVPAQLQLQGGGSITAFLNLNDVIEPDALALLVPQAVDVPIIQDAAQIAAVPQGTACADANTVYHAVNVQAPLDIVPPALLELPLSASPLLTSGCVRPVLFNSATMLWEDIPDFAVLDSEGLVLVTINKQGLYGLSGKMLNDTPFACNNLLDASEVVAGSLSQSTGTVEIQADPLTREAVITVSHIIQNPLSAKIHQGGAGENGPVLFDLGNPSSPATSTLILSLHEFELLLDGRLYIELTSSDYPDGDIRGQLDCTVVEGEGEGEIPGEGEGESPVEGEGESPVEGEGESPVEGEGESPVEGEGESPVEGEGESLVEGEGENLGEGEGESPAEGEGEGETCGCCNRSTKGSGTLLGDWLLISLALLTVVASNNRIKL